MHSWPILAQLLPDIHLRLHFGHLYSPKHRFLPWYGVSPSPLGRACRNYVRFQFPIRIGVVAAVVVVAVGAVAAAAAVADVVAVVVAADAVVVAPLTVWAQNAIRLNNCMSHCESACTYARIVVVTILLHRVTPCQVTLSLPLGRELSSYYRPSSLVNIIPTLCFSRVHSMREGGVYTKRECYCKNYCTVKKFCARSSNFSIKIQRNSI